MAVAMVAVGAVATEVVMAGVGTAAAGTNARDRVYRDRPALRPQSSGRAALAGRLRASTRERVGEVERRPRAGVFR